MKLSTRARYGLRATVDLALNSTFATGEDIPRTISLSEVSERQDVPVDYLRQIFLQLKHGGIVHSSRGRSGGFVLAKSPEHLSALDIVDALGESLEPVFCVSSPSRCKRRDVCSTRPLWCRLNDAIRSVLAATTIAQLARECPKHGIASLPKGYMFNL